MNVKFNSISIEGFRSIEKAYVELSNQGIVVVKGINEYEDNASSNGSGKSSIFEAIIFCLFEETSGGEKDVENRILNSGYCLILDFNVDDTHYVIERKCDNGKSTVLLYKDNMDISARNKTDTNKLILSILNISKDIFLDSVFLSQNAITNLASLSPTARRERLEILTNTNANINVFKEFIKNKQHIYESECVNSQLEENKLMGNKEVIDKQIYDTQLKIDKLIKDIDSVNQLGSSEDIELKINSNNAEIENCNNKLESVNNYINTFNEKLESLTTQNTDNMNKKLEYDNVLTNYRMETQNIISDISKCESEINHLSKDIQRLNKEIDNIRNSDKCPTCGRKYENINEQHIQDLINEKQLEISNIEERIKSIYDSIDQYNKNKQDVMNNIDTVTTHITSIQLDIDNINSKIDSCKTEIKSLQLDKENILASQSCLQEEIIRLQQVKDKVTQLDNSIKEYSSSLDNLNVQLNDINDKITKCKENYDKNNVLVNTSKHILQLVTKEFRTYMLQASIKYINAMLEVYSSKLFSNNEDMIYIEDTDTKLSIKLGSANYESLSGGEKTRVNIALLLAQKSLASVIGNINCNIIILDEVLGYCDSVAELKVVDLILSELDTLQTIYMVSHKEISIPYDQELIVVKNKQGVSNVSIQ